MRDIEDIVADYSAVWEKGQALRNELAEALDREISKGAGKVKPGDEDLRQEVRLEMLKVLWTTPPSSVSEYRGFMYKRSLRCAVRKRPRGNDLIDHETATIAFDDGSDGQRDRRHNGSAFVRQPDEADEYTPSADERERLRKAVSELSPARRAVMELHLAGKSNAEIADALGKKVNGVRGLMCEARASLRAMLTQKSEAA